MKDGQGFSAAWCTHSDQPHRSRQQGCNFSLSERQKSPRDILPQELSPLEWAELLWGRPLRCSHMTLSSGMSAVTSFASVSERIHSSPLNCFEVRSFSLLQKHQLSVEQETSLFRQVSCRPLYCDECRAPETSDSSGRSSCEGDDGIQVFLPFASRTRSTHRRQFDVWQRSDTCLCSGLAPSSRSVPPSYLLTTPGNPRRLGAHRTGGMSSKVQAPWDESCSPVSSAVSGALRCRRPPVPSRLP